jgi:hypothetical protein
MYGLDPIERTEACTPLGMVSAVFVAESIPKTARIVINVSLVASAVDLVQVQF